MVGTGGGADALVGGGGEPRSEGVRLELRRTDLGLSSSDWALSARFHLPLFLGVACGVGSSDSLRLLRAERRGVAA